MNALDNLCADLGLWEYRQEAGSYLPFWKPNGAIVRSVIEDLWKREHLKKGYSLVYTPHVGSAELWRQSEHLSRFSERMFPPMTLGESSEDYYLRPMNCPFHILLFKSEQRSYRDLPIAFAELGTVYRLISAGSCKQLLEVRGFTQDDAHIFCERHTAETQIGRVIDEIEFFLKDIFKIPDYKVVLRLKPPNALGEDALWNSAQGALRRVLADRNIPADPQPGEGVFYGPKIDFEVSEPRSSRRWVCSTIQYDIVLAEKFGITFAGKDNAPATPVIIHRTILGSLERFVALLVAHTGGLLPVWIAPCQVRLVPLRLAEGGANDLEYAKSVKAVLENRLLDLSPRVSVETRIEDHRMALKEAAKVKVPYVVFIGGHERMSGLLAVKTWQDGKLTRERKMGVDELAEELRGRIVKRT